MEWQRLRVFYYVAKAQSITRASAELRIAQPSITRTIQQLEHQAKAKLFIRHPRGLTLTKQGEILFNRVKNMATELELAKNEISGAADDITGSLRITTAYGFASTVFAKYICNFSKRYPDIRINLICDDTDLDLTKREADVSIRPFDVKGEELEQIFLYTRKIHLYASPEYLQEMGIPKKPEDLDHHKIIVFANPNNPTPYFHTTWNLTVGVKAGYKREPYMTANSTECLFQMAEAGLGVIGLSDDSNLLRTKTLVRVLPSIEGPPVDLYYVYPKSLENLLTVKVLKEYLIESFSKNQG